MPSPVRPRDNSSEPVAARAPSGQRTVAPQRDGKSDLAVELPGSPPDLTHGGARALLRVLLKASRARSDATVPDEGEPEVLAS